MWCKVRHPWIKWLVETQNLSGNVKRGLWLFQVNNSVDDYSASFKHQNNDVSHTSFGAIYENTTAIHITLFVCLLAGFGKNKNVVHLSKMYFRDLESDLNPAEDLLLLWTYLSREPPSALCMWERQTVEKVCTQFSRDPQQDKKTAI